MSGNVIAFPNARPKRGPVTAPRSETVRVIAPGGGWRQFDTLGAALAEILLEAEAGGRTFMIDIRKPPDETEPEHAQ